MLMSLDGKYAALQTSYDKNFGVLASRTRNDNAGPKKMSPPVQLRGKTKNRELTR